MKTLLSATMAGVILFCLSSVYGQIPESPVTVQSPNTASLGLYGEMPVSLFAGLPTIDIPLYQFEEQSLKLPLTLNYHASGVRPDMHPGWVGLGWSLDAGGVISRVVKDMADDYDNGSYFQGSQSGFYWKYSLLANNNWDQIPYMQNIARGNNTLYDTEPDEFSFSFPGGSGKFYLDHTRNWKVKCDKPIRVTFNDQFLEMPFIKPNGTRMNGYGNTKSFSGFTITDERGNQYVYGGNTNAIEYEIGMFTQMEAEWIAQSWYLTKIIAADGYELNLNYEKDNYVNQLYISIYIDKATRTVNSGGIFNPQPSCSSGYGDDDDNLKVEHFYDGKLISPSYLRSIIGSHCKVYFDRSTSTELNYSPAVYDYQYRLWSQGPYFVEFIPCLSTDGVAFPDNLNKLQWKKLDRIRVEDKDGKLQKRFEFTYNNIAAERLMLKMLTEFGYDNKWKPSYQFFYDESQVLPPYLANKSDHWGFYNGTYADISNLSAYYSYRQPNNTYLLAGTMNKIIYPTGNVTELTYEPHQYGKRLQMNRTNGIDATYNENTLAGGLRVKKITSYELISPNQKITKEYFYVNGYDGIIDPGTLLSSGILGGQVLYDFSDYRTNAFNDNGVTYSKSIFSSQSVLPACNNSMGSHIGYSEVTERLSDGSYTRYFFTNFDNGHIDEAVPCLQLTRTPYEPGSSLEIERGLLIREEMYNSNNILVHKRVIDYIALHKSDEYIRAMMARNFNVCQSTGVSVEEGTAYRNYTYSYLPVKETVTEYDTEGGNPMETVQNFSYNSQYRQLSKESSTNSKGEEMISYYRYPYDVLGYTPADDASAEQTTAYMIQHNYVGLPIEVISTKMENGVEHILNSQLTQYQSFDGLIKPAYDYRLSVTTPLLKSLYSNYTVTGFSTGESFTKDSRLELIQQYYSYSRRGNVLEYAKASDTHKSYVWGYGDQFCIAEIANATNDLVAYTSFEDGELGGWTKGSSSVIYENNGNVTGTKSFSGTLTRNVGASGVFIVSLWGASNGTQTVNGVNGNVIKTKGGKVLKQWRLDNPTAVTIVGNNIDDVRFYPEGAEMVTYSYDPIKGMTSKTDVNNLSTFYSYDNFGRLLFERDDEGNLIKKIIYNYRDNPGVVYYNKRFAATYRRKCFGLGDDVEYVVPAGTYSSVISQQDADNSAVADAAENGQYYANLNGGCDVAPLDLRYVKSGASIITVSYENVYTHRLYSFTFSQPVTALTHFGSLPKGYYNVTISSSDTAPHAFGIGLSWQDSPTNSATFLNARMLYEIDFMVIVNGN